MKRGNINENSIYLYRNIFFYINAIIGFILYGDANSDLFVSVAGMLLLFIAFDLIKLLRKKIREEKKENDN